MSSAGLALGMYFAAQLSRELAGALHVSGWVFSPTGLILLWLLLSPRRAAPLLIVAGVVGVGLGLSGSGASLEAWKFPLLIGAYNAGLYFLLRRLFPYGFSVREPRDLLVYHLLAAPAAVAFVLAHVVLVGQWANFGLTQLLNRSLSEMISLAVLVPGVLGLTQLRALLSERRWPPMGLAALAAAIAISAGVLFQEHYPLLFLVPTALLLASVELEVFGAAVGVLTIAVLVTIASLTGHGPTTMMGEPRLAQVIVMQVFLLAASMASFGMGATAAQKREAGRRLAEEAQRAALAESVGGVAYWRLELPSKALTWSSGMYAIFGVEPGLSLPFEESLQLIHPEDRDRFRSALERVARGAVEDTSRRLPTRVVRADGAVRYISGKMIAEYGRDGVVAAVFGTLIDVTDQHLSAQAVAESEARFRHLAENTSDVIVRVGSDGELIYASPSIERVLGVTPEMARASLAGDLHPDDAETFYKTFGKLRRGELPPGSRLRHRRQHLKGHFVWLETAPTPLFDETGQLVEIVDVMRDITHQKALEDDLERAKTAAEAAAEVKSHFLANMSHELRTPLTAVLGFSWLIERQPELSDATKSYVARLSTAGAALHAIINDVLDFSRLEAGRVDLKPRPVRPADLLRDTTETFSFSAESKGLILRCEGLDALPAQVALDPERLRQVLMNLVGNAMKFTDAGEVVVKARHDRRGQLRIEVTDTGPGIPAGERARLFQRFSQIDGSATRRHGGSGLGLAICKGIVEAMGGDIGVRGRAAGGSTFWIRIPAPLAGEVTVATPPVLETPQAGLRVLVVDDHPVNRQLARAVLEPFGVEVTEAGGGGQAIEAAGAGIFDVILMDVRMPEVDGVTAMQAIRASDGPNAASVILAFSAEGEEFVAERIEAGFDGHVAKPMTVDGLRGAVARAARLRPHDAEAA